MERRARLAPQPSFRPKGFPIQVDLSPIAGACWQRVGDAVIGLGSYRRVLPFRSCGAAPLSPRGGIGRRNGLKIRFPTGSPGSSPGAGTTIPSGGFQRLPGKGGVGQAKDRTSCRRPRHGRLSPGRCPAPCHARFLVGKFARRSLTEGSALTDQASRSEEGPATSRLRLHSGLDRIRVLMQPVRRAGQRPVGLSAAPT